MRGLLLLVVLVVGGCAGPMPRRVVTPGAVYLPVMPVGAGYRWAGRGFGHPPEAWAVGHEALVGGGRPVWFHDWWWDCGRWMMDRAVYVPSVARAWYSGVLQCDDGRPLLVLNEPEDPNQANLSPARAAELLHTASLAWRRGEVWCCGTQVQHLGYAQQLLAAYRAMYGEWPAAGWHVHVYSQRAGRTYNATAVMDVVEGVAALDVFVAWAAGEGVLGRGVVISEYGVLSDRVVELALMETFERELDARPAVRSRAWFSVRYAPWAASDLVEDDGELTALGRAWVK